MTNSSEIKVERVPQHYPIFRIIEKYLMAGGRIHKSHGRIVLVDKDGEYLCGGDTLQELFLNAIWTFC